MNLQELQAKFRKVTIEKLKIGSIVKVFLTQDDGITLKNKIRHEKFIVVVGIDKENNTIFGSLLINSKLNPASDYSVEILSAQYMVYSANYENTLEHDSYIDCSQIFSFSFNKLKDGIYCGEITENDKKGIFHILETTETLTTKQKKRFGIKRN